MSEIQIKQCSRKERCVNPLGAWLPATTEYFAPLKSVKSGLRPECRACTRAEARSRVVRKPRKGGSCHTFPQQYRDLAQERGIEWIGLFPGSTNRKTAWKCKKGHVWYAKYADLRYQKYGCPLCSRQAPKTYEDYSALAQSKTWQLLDKLPKNTKTKVHWRCENGHNLYASYNNVLRGMGCGQCQGRVNGCYVSRPQVELRDRIGGVLNLRVGSYSADIAITINDLTIDVEYDSWYWHRGKEIQDSERDKFFIDRGWRILRIKSGNLLPATYQFNDACDNLVKGAIYQEIILLDWRDGQ